MTMKNPTDIRFAFFGTSHIAVYVLDELARASLSPALIVTVPGKPQGRGMQIQETPVAQWARAHGIPFSETWEEFEASAWEVAVVVDYGKILPRRIIDIPERGFLNVHPSLLPRLRGPSPIRSAILRDDREVGVTVMLLDEKMDHGPIVAQKRVEVAWPPRVSELERGLLSEGGKLLAAMLPTWVSGDIDATPQNDDVATYCEKFEKRDGELDLSEDAYRNLLKIRALEGWPGTFAFFVRSGKTLRVQILEAHLENGALVIDRVKPEGKGEMSYADFARSGAVPATRPTPPESESDASR